MKSSRNQFSCLLSLACVFCMLIGCGPGDNSSDLLRAQNATNMQKVANAYKLYAFVHGHVGPKTKDEFKEFLKTSKAISENLKIMEINLADLDSYFVSDLDGKEFDFRWGVDINPELAIDPIVFDQTGAEGMRRIMLACDVILEVTDDNKYNRLKAGKIDRKNDVPASVFGTGGVDESVEENIEL